MIARATLGLFVAVVVAAPRAAAQEIQEFEQARAAYDARDFARAVFLFEQLVGAEVPRLTSSALVLEARKYYGAALLFVGQREAARRQFELLLRADPDYPLDPLLFPSEVQELFASVRARLQSEREAAEAQARLQAELARERERAARLLAIAEDEVLVDVEHARWPALIPWGTGQFLNGNDGLGWFFCVSETLALGAAFTTLALHDEFLRFANAAVVAADSDAVARANEYLNAAFVANWLSIATLAVLAVAGVIEAQLSFVPSHSVRHRRPVPDELREGLRAGTPPDQEDEHVVP